MSSADNGGIELSQFEFEDKNKCCNSPNIRKILAIIYDIFTLIVSFLDVITDILVLIEFYIDGKMIFFYSSLTILLIAQFAYTIAFWFRFLDSFNGDGPAVIGCCCLLPFAPILSYLFYFTENKKTPCYRCLSGIFGSMTCSLDCHSSANSINNDNNNDKIQALKEWAEEKTMKHLGFIIEALIESFPQSILQLIAIIYYNDTNNYIAMFSILLSMISVSTKSFILSVNISYNWKSSIFNWISCLIDFLGIFCMISFIFYIPSNLSQNEINPFEIMQKVWIYSILITVIPFTMITSTILNLYFVFRDLSDIDLHCCDLTCFGAVLVMQIIWIIGLCLSLMAMSIASFVIFSGLLMVNGLSFRLSSGSSNQFYLQLLSFINNAKHIVINDYYDENEALIISKKNHQIIRICCINRVLFESITSSLNKHIILHNYCWKNNVYDKKLHNYLIQESINKNHGEYPYINVSLKDIKSDKNNVEKTCVSLCKKWINSYQKIQDSFFEIVSIINVDDEYKWISFIIFYFLVPLYFIGRIFHAFFMIIIVLFLLFGYNINVFSNDLPLYQNIMFGLYLFFLFLWIIFLFLMLNEQYYSKFILPSTKKLIASDDCKINEKKILQIMDYYHSVISQFVAQTYCIKLFGKDITFIIMELHGVGSYQFHKFDLAEKENSDSS